VNRRAVAGAVVLLVPVVITLPWTLWHERTRAHLADPYAALERRIPRDATIAVRGDAFERAAAIFALAPRQVVAPNKADWIVAGRR
jgi:hypothetical protein